MNGDMLDTNVIIRYLSGDEATTAKSHQSRLLTFDNHFKAVDDLKVVP